MNDYTFNNIESSRREYEALLSSEWRKDYFNEENGGFVVTHVLKGKDVMKREGIAKEVLSCLALANNGKRILRLPENTLDKIDFIMIDGQPYRNLLKFTAGSEKPKGYPDAYFEGQTWDFKTSTFKNEDSLRHAIKDGRKADNIIFIVNSEEREIEMIEKAIKSEIGRRKKDNAWLELPDVYVLVQGEIVAVWNKKKAESLCL